ncbi:MAG: hypothetical protein WBB68_02020 [Candidatus Moraniibacteriota bacterium]
MNYDIPSQAPTPEKGPRFLTLQEIQEQLRVRLEKLTKQESLREVRVQKDEQGGVLLYEVAVTGLDGNDALYTYRRVGDRSLSTNIEVTYYAGAFLDDPNEDRCVGGATFSTYDEATGKWTDQWTDEEVQETLSSTAHRTAPVIIEGSAVEVAPEGAKRLTFVPADSESAGHTAEEAKERTTLSTGGELAEFPEGEGLIERIRTPELRQLYAAFDQAEAILGTVDVATFIYKEVEDIHEAMRLRSLAKPFLEKTIYPELIRLNKSGSLSEPLSQWNPEGDLTEDEFDELSLRRKKLSNVIGILHKDPATGKLTIRHTLNDI